MKHKMKQLWNPRWNNYETQDETIMKHKMKQSWNTRWNNYETQDETIMKLQYFDFISKLSSDKVSAKNCIACFTGEVHVPQVATSDVPWEPQTAKNTPTMPSRTTNAHRTVRARIKKKEADLKSITHPCI